MRIRLINTTPAVTIIALIIYYALAPTNLLAIVTCLAALSFVFTMHYIYELKSRYWILLVVAITGSVIRLVFPVIYSLVIQYIVLLIFISYYSHFTPLSEDEFTAYLSIAIISLIISIYQKIEYFPWIILGPILESHIDEPITGAQVNRKVIYVSFLIGLALGLPLPLLILAFVTSYMYRIHHIRGWISVVDETVRLIYMVILRFLGGIW